MGPSLTHTHTVGPPGLGPVGPSGVGPVGPPGVRSVGSAPSPMEAEVFLAQQRPGATLEPQFLPEGWFFVCGNRRNCFQIRIGQELDLELPRGVWGRPRVTVSHTDRQKDGQTDRQVFTGDVVVDSIKLFRTRSGHQISCCAARPTRSNTVHRQVTVPTYKRTDMQTGRQCDDSVGAAPTTAKADMVARDEGGTNLSCYCWTPSGSEPLATSLTQRQH